MMIIKRRSILIAIALTAALILSACGSGKDETIKRPVVRLQVGDQSYQEGVYQDCWPSAADDWDCDLNAVALVQPAQSVNIGEGDEVRFVVEDEGGTVQQFRATLLDGPGGTQDFGTGKEGVYNADLPDGSYRVQVEVKYSAIEGVEIPAGYEPFVSYVFGLEVAGVVLPTPTPTLTSTPTVTPTPTSTPTATNTPLPTSTPLPTATNTPQPTDTPTPVPSVTLTETGPVVEGTPQATSAPPPTDTPQATPAAGIELGSIAITGTVRLSSAGATVTVAGAGVTYSYVSAALSLSGSATTDANGQFRFDPILFYDTAQIAVTASAPGYLSQSIQRAGADAFNAGGVFDFVLQPVSAQPIPSAVPTGTLPPVPVMTATPPPEVPSMSLTFIGRSYSPVGYQFCQRAATGERVCVALPVEDAPPGRIVFQRGSSVQINIAAARPTEVSIAYQTDTGLPIGQPDTRPGDNTLLFLVTPEPGSYILAIHVLWAEEDATYFFRITVTD
jgi:hypothetical protein